MRALRFRSAALGAVLAASTASSVWAQGDPAPPGAPADPAVPPLPAPVEATPPAPAPAPEAPAQPLPDPAPQPPPASAHTPAPPSTPTPPQATSAPEWGPASTSGAEDLAEPERTRRARDAHADRVVLFPTAETQPEGSFFVSSYELVFIQLGYAVSDSVQLSALFLPPLVEGQPFFFSPTVKWNVARGENGNVALLGGLDLVANVDDDSAVLGRLGGVGQLCFDPACDSSLSGNAHLWTQLGEDGDSGTIILLSAGATIRASELVSLLVEPSYPLVLQEGEIDGPEGFLLSYGVRLSGARFGLDLTFVRPFGEEFAEELLLGLPFVVASYRSDGN